MPKFAPHRHELLPYSGSSAGARRGGPVLALLLASFAAGVPSRAAEPADCAGAKTAVEAIRTCSQVLERSGLDADTRRRLLIRRGAAWLGEDEPDDAVADFTLALALAPTDVEALTGRARAHTKAGDHAMAAADWSGVIAQHAGTVELIAAAYHERAASLFAAGDSDGALADYAKILELDPKSITAHIGRGKVHAARGDRAKALDEFAIAMAIEPENTAPYIARAQVAERWGDTKMAIADYTFVVRNNSRSAGPYRQALKRLGVDTPP